MAFPTTDQLLARLEPVAQAHGLDVEGIKVNRAGKKSLVAIYLDGEQRPDLDQLEKVSQELSGSFDAAEQAGELNFGAGYTLEVSTPGVDMPLSKPRQWRRNRGRLVKIEGQQWRIGALAPDETQVILVRQHGKKLEVKALQLDPPPTAMVEIEFASPAPQELELSTLDFEQAMDWREENK